MREDPSGGKVARTELQRRRPASRAQQGDGGGAASGEHESLLGLQRTAGNAAVARAIETETGGDEETARDLESRSETTTGVRIPITPALLGLVGGGRKRNPDLPFEDVFTTRYGPVAGTPFVRDSADASDIDPSDVDQGSLGDCFLLASLAAIARANPEIIRNAITDNGDGTYTVKLHFIFGPMGLKISKDVTVTPTFPLAGGGTAYAGKGDVDPSGTPELWAMLIEKAYAKAIGGYDELDEGGDSEEGLAALTGKEAESWDADDYEPGELLTKIEKLLADGWALTAETIDESFLADFLMKAREQKVVLGHVYTIMGVNPGAGTLDLRNPWAREHLTGFPARHFAYLFETFKGVKVR
jgi:hypothetical protein